jgi:mannose-6-phosphate isomerase-like protein (cupin superfamily)
MIVRPDEAAEFATDERCAILELWNRAADGDVSIARARVAPGVTTQWHRVRGVVERYLIVSGRGRASVGEAPPAEVGPGDLVVIPAGERQRIANVGAGDLVFYCVCTPRFTQDRYESLE